MIATFVPSKYQQVVFDFVANGRGDGIVRAVAGSGKTTTLVHCASLIKAERAVFLAFNKHIAEALEVKLQGTTMKARTIHSVGNGCLYKAFGKTKINDRKYYQIAQTWAEKNRLMLALHDLSPFEAARRLSKLCDMARMTLTDPLNLDALAALALDYQIEKAAPILSGAAYVLKEGVNIAQYRSEIDFTDMIWLPNRLDLSPSPMDWVFIDECQDLSAAQLGVVLKMRAPGGRMLFVGDPKQAIMGFAGADCQSFNKIRQVTGATELPLSINYRCPTSHLDRARKIVPEIEARPDAPVGVLETIKGSELVGVAREGDLILCRTTAPLINLCIRFIEQKISARVRGRDVGRDLVDLLNGIVSNYPGVPYERLGDTLQEFKDKQVFMLSQKAGNEGRIAALEDRIEALFICWKAFNDCTSVEALCAEIQGLFSDDRASVWLSTVHRAKGLENPRVFILHPEKLPLIWENQSAEQYEQEVNLLYVALTRSLAELYIVQHEVPADGKKEDKPAPQQAESRSGEGVLEKLGSAGAGSTDSALSAQRVAFRGGVCGQRSWYPCSIEGTGIARLAL